MRKRLFGNLFIATTLIGFGLTLATSSASAHGYVETPPARGYQGQLDKESLGWGYALNI